MRSVLPGSIPLTLLFVAACAHPAPDELFGKLQSAAPAKIESPLVSAGPKACQRDWQCGDGSLCIEGRCVAITAGLEACKSGRVHFDFDQDAVHPNEYSALQRMARCLKADHKMHIDIDGNTDERGTLEYNLALGDKRARAVAGYLRDLGVSDKQIGTVTYGKDRPLCSEHDEACWKENRRAGLVANRFTSRSP
jgi:peptidoglycan-associated lipoprotein